MDSNAKKKEEEDFEADVLKLISQNQIVEAIDLIGNRSESNNRLLLIRQFYKVQRHII